MSDIVIGGWSDTWRTDLGYASVRSPDIRPPPQTISYTYQPVRIALWHMMMFQTTCDFVNVLPEFLGVL